MIPDEELYKKGEYLAQQFILSGNATKDSIVEGPEQLQKGFISVINNHFRVQNNV